MKQSAKEKAVELFDKYFEYVEAFSSNQQHENAKQCALIAVNEIFELDIYKCWSIEPKYWTDVKIEINKL